MSLPLRKGTMMASDKGQASSEQEMPSPAPHEQGHAGFKNPLGGPGEHLAAAHVVVFGLPHMRQDGLPGGHGHGRHLGLVHDDGAAVARADDSVSPARRWPTV